MNRLSVILLFCLSIACRSAAPDPVRPNVLFIAVDDLRPELGAYGNKHIKSPNIDRLAAGGVTFTRAYVQQAVCNPSRASVMTGLRPDTLKVWDLQANFRDAVPEAVTLPQHFKQHGYHTAAIGKIYHNVIPDPLSWSEPKLQIDGYPFDPDAVYRAPEQVAYIEARKAEIIAAGNQERYIDRFGEWYLKAGATESPDVPDDAYFDGAQTGVAVEKLAALRSAGTPFFLAIGYYRPHLPFNAPRRYWDLYDADEIPMAANPRLAANAPLMAINNMRELRGYTDFRDVVHPSGGVLSEARARHLKHGYYASVSYIDAQVGRLLDALDELGLAGNTIVVLWGDHGWKLGEQASWAKMTNYEVDTRAPLIIRAPGFETAGRGVEGLVEFVDIYPTLCELANLPVRGELEGVSAVPLMLDPSRPGKDAAFSQFLREGIWTAPDGVEYMGYAIRTDRYRYVSWMNWESRRHVAHELYDHGTDPDETINLAASPAHTVVVEELDRRLHERFGQ